MVASNRGFRSQGEMQFMSTAAGHSPRDRVIGLVRDILERRSAARDFAVDDDLREVGLTSLDLVNLMLAVEAEFDLKIADVDMTLRNFRSVAAIEALLASLRPVERADRGVGRVAAST